MKAQIARVIKLGSFTFLSALAAAWPAKAQDAKTAYPNMAPLEQYLIADRDAEIALARSAAPDSVSRDAEVLVLSRQGYESAVKGKNGFACIVDRSWSKPSNDPDFWDPKVRGPICFNAPAARFYIPRVIKKTELVLAGRSKAQIFDAITAALASKELTQPESGAMCYMMSKQGFLSEEDGHWHPHLMFFLPKAVPAAWGEDLPGSPIISFQDAVENLTTYLVPVRRWSDGTPDILKNEQ